MTTTPQERLALGVAAFLLAIGAAARYATGPAPAADWPEPPAATAELRERTAAEVGRARVRATPLRADERIDPNTASADELARLPRIGPALAARIVAHREAEGPFRTLDDLRAVAGIGPSTLDGLAPHVALAPAPPLPAVAPSASRAAARAGPPAAPIDLNRATAVELQQLPGVGAVLAERIVRFREENGPFGAVAELERVPGIGSRMRERLAPYLRVGP